MGIGFITNPDRFDFTYQDISNVNKADWAKAKACAIAGSVADVTLQVWQRSAAAHKNDCLKATVGVTQPWPC